MVALLKTTAMRGLVEQEEGLYTREGVLRAFGMIPGMHERSGRPGFRFRPHSAAAPAVPVRPRREHGKRKYGELEREGPLHRPAHLREWENAGDG